MSDDSGLPTVSVIETLKASGVEVSRRTDGSTLIVGSDSTLIQYFGEMVSRKFLHKIARKFGVPIHHFYHPEMIVTSSLAGPTAQEQPKGRPS